MVDKIGSNYIMKVGIVVRDIHEAAKYYERLFTLEDRIVIKKQRPKKDYYPKSYQEYGGERVNAELTWFIVDLNPIYLQVVQPCDDLPSPWLSYLQEHGPGVCFISFCVSDFADHVNFMESNGMPLTFIEEKGFERYAYFATQEKLGFTLELKERKTIDS